MHSDTTDSARLAEVALAIQANPYIPHQPFAQQLAFLAHDGVEALYGGAAGGGKSDALLMAALMHVDRPGYGAILFRRALSDLRLDGALLSRAQAWLGPTDARWDGAAAAWRFPSGARLSFGYLAGPMDPFRYQSAEFQFIGFDELTQFGEAAYLYLRSRLRRPAGTGAGSLGAVPLRLRAASNPGGPGHDWVFQRFVDPRTRAGAFFPSGLADNAHLDREAYGRELAALDPVTRAQLRDGDWTVRRDGTLFRRAWLPVRGQRADRAAARVRGWDLAATPAGEARDPDWTVGALCAWEGGGIVIEDIVRLRAGPGQVAHTVRATAEADGPDVAIVMEQEPGASGKHLIADFRERLEGFEFRALRKTTAKAVMAQPLAALAEQGRVRLVPGPWVEALVDELTGFPLGAHDDQVDAIALAHQELARRVRRARGVPLVRPHGVDLTGTLTGREGPQHGR